jgi:hypothetical protein
MSILKTDQHYYVYEWFRPDTGECFYAGKGSGKRAWSYYRRNYVFRRVIAELSEKNLTPNVCIFRTNLANKEALKIERARMAYWAGKFITLSNKTGTYRRKLKRLKRMRSAPSPEVLARVQKVFG